MSDAEQEASASFITWLGFTAMCVGMFMAILDIQIVASSLPNISGALNIPEDRLSWIQTCYLISEIIAIPLTGFLTRAFSVRWLFAGATVGFTLASIGCAASTDFAMLVTFRTIQGFFGGALIPVVFTTVFEIFPRRQHPLATVVAGTFAMLAPTVGPVFGGFLTQTFSWHAIFLVNVIPGIPVAALVAFCIRHDRPDFRELKRIDYGTVLLAAIFLASLELLLKQAPKQHWHGTYIYVLLGVCLLALVATVQQCLTRTAPFVHLRRFADKSFSIACFLSFCLGLGLYGATYLLPLFLGFVRRHTALEIGEIMVVAGAAQLLCAPVAAILEPRINGWWLVTFGYVLFAAGVIADAFCTTHTDFTGLIVPQVLRGVGIMFCILPSTRLAMEGWPEAQIPEASALFNLMRNLGGAIGIALVDTVVEQRTQGHVDAFVHRLQAGDADTAREIGLPTAMFHGHAMGQVSGFVKEMIAPMLQRAALNQSFNEAWLWLGGFFLLSLLALSFSSPRAFTQTAYSARNEQDGTLPHSHQ